MKTQTITIFVLLLAFFMAPVFVSAQEETHPEPAQEETPTEEAQEEEEFFFDDENFFEEEFEEEPLRDETGFKEFDISYFEQNLDYVRGVLAERQTSTIMAMQHNKLDKTLDGFLKTEFMEEFRSLRLEAESLASTFKARSSRMPPEDVVKVKKAYDVITIKFNRQLEDIKRDFLDRKRMRAIRDNKDLYSNSLQYKLRELQDAYANDFQKVVVEVTGTDKYSAFPLAAIVSLIKLAVDVGEYIINANYEAKRLKEDHLNQFFIEPNRFRPWNELDHIEGDIYAEQEEQEFNFDEEPEDSWQDMEPFEDEELDSASPKRKKTKKPKKPN